MHKKLFQAALIVVFVFTLAFGLFQTSTPSAALAAAANHSTFTSNVSLHTNSSQFRICDDGLSWFCMIPMVGWNT